MPGVHHRARAAVWCALACALTAAAAQPPTDPEPKTGGRPKTGAQPKATAAGPDVGAKLPADTNVYLVLRTGSHVTPKQIETILRDDMKAVGATIKGDVKVVPIAPVFVEEFENLLGKAAPAPVNPPGDGPTIAPLPSRQPLYELVFPDKQVVLSLRVKMQVRTEKGEYKEETQAFAPGKYGDKGPLVPTAPGRYVFAPPADANPISFDADVQPLGAEKKVVACTWPVADRFYVVTLRGFAGDKQKLFDRAGSSEFHGNPLEIVPLGGDQIFAFARLDSSAGKMGGDELDPDNKLTIRVDAIPNRSAKRAWVLFPLKVDKGAKGEPGPNALSRALKEYGDKDEAALPAAIRAAKPVIAGDAAQVGPDDTPRWFEMTGVGKAGERPSEFVVKVKLNDLPTLADRFDPVGMLVVWEFDNGTKQEAIQVEHPVSKRRVFAVERERAWADILQRAIQKQGGPKAPK